MSNSLKDQVQETVDRLISDGVVPELQKRMEVAQAAHFRSMAELMGGMRADASGKPKNTAAKALIAFGKSRFNLQDAIDSVKDQEDVVKALTSSTGAGGGFRLQDEVAIEVFDKLRAESIVLQRGPIIVPLGTGNLTIPGLATGVNGAWQGENTNTTHTTQTLRQVVLTGKLFGALIAISNQLIDRGGPDVERMVNNDLTLSLRLAIDVAYMRSDGSNFQPRGILDRANTKFDANSTVNVANVVADLIKAINTLEQSDIQMVNPGWLMAPRTKNFLMGLLDGDGQFIFGEQIGRKELFGIPFSVSTQIPVNLGGGGDESELYLVDFDNVIIGQEQDIEIVSSDGAAYFNGTEVVSGFSQNQTVLRANIVTDIQLRHTETAVIVEAVKWI